MFKMKNLIFLFWSLQNSKGAMQIKKKDYVNLAN